MKLVFALSLFTAAPSFAGTAAEYHWTICESTAATIGKKLGAPGLSGEDRYVYYLDTNDRALYRSGLVLRLRGDREKGKLESTVKVRIDPEDVPASWQSVDGFKCEQDFHGQQTSTHCSLEEKIDPDDLTQFLKAGGSAEKLLTKTQKKFLKAIGRTVSWIDLKGYGPVADSKWKLDAGVGKLDLESYRLSSGGSLFELSSKAKSPSASEYGALTRKLKNAQIKLCPKQTSKTAWVLGVS
jgi:hypothetical protein